MKIFISILIWNTSDFRSKIFNWITSGVPTIQHPELYDGWPSEDNNIEELTLIEL